MDTVRELALATLAVVAALWVLLVAIWGLRTVWIFIYVDGSFTLSPQVVIPVVMVVIMSAPAMLYLSWAKGRDWFI